MIPKKPFNNRVWNYLSSTLQEFADVLSTYLPSSQLTYKVYTALLTQTGTDAPVATVLENTLGTINYTYDGPGNYTITIAGGTFTANKTYIVTQIWGGNGTSPLVGVTTWEDSTTLTLYVRDLNKKPANTIGYDCPPVCVLTSIEIRVYN